MNDDTCKALIYQMALNLLRDDSGISEQSYMSLVDLLKYAGHIDIINAIEATDGRFYLPESFFSLIEDTPNDSDYNH